MAAVLLLPAAAGEQNTWEFTRESGGLGAPIQLFFSQNFPSESVPVGALFHAHATSSVDDNSLDISGNGIQTQGCTLIESTILPGTGTANWREATLTIRMDNATCVVSHSMQVLNGASVVHNHTFAFTVTAYDTLEFGQDPLSTGLDFWINLFIGIAAVFVFFLAGMEFPMAASVMFVLGTLVPELDFTIQWFAVFTLLGVVGQFLFHRFMKLKGKRGNQ